MPPVMRAGREDAGAARRDCDAMPNPNKGLPAGTPAPDFALPAPDGSTVRLGDYRGGWVVLYFDRGTF